MYDGTVRINDKEQFIILEFVILVFTENLINGSI